MSKKQSIILFASVFFAAVIVPIVINILMFRNIFPVKGDIDTWISSLSSFWGSIIGGALTLIGVKLTIDQQTKIFEKQEKRYKEEKNIQAQYIKNEVFHLIIENQTLIKSFNEHNYDENLKNIHDKCIELQDKIDKMLPVASTISEPLLSALKTVYWSVKDITEFIDKAIEEDIDQQWVENELLNGQYYQRLALADVLFMNTIDDIKYQK